MTRVTHLFVKPDSGAKPRDVTELLVSPDGIIGNVSCVLFRQVLLTSLPVLQEMCWKPGQLRENLVVDFDSLYRLPSGTVIKIGEASIRLTFHCEPCHVVLAKNEIKKAHHKRGVFGSFLNTGKIMLADRLVVTEQVMEEIPYAPTDRIRWYLSKQKSPISARRLLQEVGLPNAYARALPAILRKMPELSGVVFSKGHHNEVFAMRTQLFRNWL